MDPAVKLEVAAASRLQPIREAAAAGDSDVQRFYCGRVVFVTGGSGFLGKQLVEKLLRICKVSKVYMLLRSKKGKSIQERFDDLMKDSAYKTLREEQPDFASKITPIEGDVSEIRLGINDEDWKTVTQEVEVIFHVAATTRFDEPLRVATLINIRGTRECLNLGKASQHLRSYVHVSTAYTHTTTKTIGEKVQEKFYNSPIVPSDLISMAENMDNERLQNITANLINGWPNTYSFTKAVSEELIRTSSDGLPICIVRPGIVLSSVNEPTPGWIDPSAIYSASGLMTGVGTGIIHTILVDVNVSLGLIPCDFVNSTAIAAGREAAVTQLKGGTDTKIYAVIPINRNPVTWTMLGSILRRDCFPLSTPSAIYYAYVIETKNNLLFKLLSLLMHVIPAIVVDFICLLLGKERRFYKLSKKIYNMCNALSYFLCHSWTIDDHNTATLYNSLSKQDKILFNFDITDINWKEYITSWWCLGLRKHLIKDGLKNTEYALKKQKIFEIIHYCITPLYLYALYRLAYFVLSSVVGLITGTIFV